MGSHFRCEQGELAGIAIAERGIGIECNKFVCSSLMLIEVCESEKDHDR